MERHNCCLNTKAIIDYISNRNGPVHELLTGLEEELLGIASPLNFLCDPHNWVSSEVCRRMYANARRITGDEKVAFHIGYESVVQKRLGYIQEIMVRALGSPGGALKRSQAINEKFNRNKQVELVSLGKNQAMIRLHWDPTLDLNTDFCLMNRGVYTALFTVWGLPPGEVIENECQFKGGPYCEFDIRWVNHSLWGRLKLLFNNRRRLLSQTLSEIEQDKRLLDAKFWEIQKLNRSLQEKVAQLWSIQQASGAILSELDFQTIFPEVLRIFIKEIGYSRGMIMLIDQENQVLRYIEGVGAELDEFGPLNGYEIPLTRTHNILVKVVRTGQPVVAPDVSGLNLNPNNVIIRNFEPQSVVILPLMSRGKVIGVLAADRGSQSRAEPTLDRDFLQGFANQVALAIENARMYKSLRESYLISIQALVEALEAKDAYTRGHSERVTTYSVRLAEFIGLPAFQIEQIKNMCLVHDIGKIGIDRVILNKNGQLLDSEYKSIRRHPLIGARIIEPLQLTWEETAIVKHHHERFDGLGYPDQLSGQEIPVQVRVAAICDAFDAMTSDRPYRAALTVENSLQQLLAGAGTQFDPDLVNSFLKMVRSGKLRDVLIYDTSKKKIA